MSRVHRDRKLKSSVLRWRDSISSISRDSIRSLNDGIKIGQNRGLSSQNAMEWRREKTKLKNLYKKNRNIVNARSSLFLWIHFIQTTFRYFWRNLRCRFLSCCDP